MNEEMKFPKTFEEFIKQYSFFDKQQIYTNGSELIQVFRIKQWEEHKEKENQELKKQVDELNRFKFSCKKDETRIPATIYSKKTVEDLFNENRNLRKKLENCMTFEDYKYTLNKKIKLETQQKEFIKYLEDKKISPIKCVLNSIDDKNHDYNMFKNKLDNYEEILQKYREIIGVEDESR
jgi:hypothetical protein